MKKSEFNTRIRNYVKDSLSPKEAERSFVSEVYVSVQDVLGVSNCLQIGSYPRFTAITPLHDLDILYILGSLETDFDPSETLDDLQKELKTNYQNPTQYSSEISRQTHSITIKFSEGADEVFSVDIVPAYISGKNEFGDDMYVVPEIVTRSHSDRRQIEKKVAEGEDMKWIKSDPRGYITTATEVNATNDDFRKTVKFIKGWRAGCKDQNDDFPLKSFHLEQIVTTYFQNDPSIEIFDAVFRFFRELPEYIQAPTIPDRANPSKNIDEYIERLTDQQKRWINLACNYFLIKLENFSEDDDVGDLLIVRLHERSKDKHGNTSEEYLFDEDIPTFTETDFSIVGHVLARNGSFRPYVLDQHGVIEIDRHISFRIGHDAPEADLYKWKVKNDDSSEQPRGEITDHQTFNDPEQTAYSGSHYVECFAIKDGVCIGRARQNVVLRWLKERSP